MIQVKGTLLWFHCFCWRRFTKLTQRIVSFLPLSCVCFLSWIAFLIGCLADFAVHWADVLSISFLSHAAFAFSWLLFLSLLNCFFFDVTSLLCLLFSLHHLHACFLFALFYAIIARSFMSHRSSSLLLSFISTIWFSLPLCLFADCHVLFSRALHRPIITTIDTCVAMMETCVIEILLRTDWRTLWEPQNYLEATQSNYSNKEPITRAMSPTRNFSLFVEGSLTKEGDKCIVHMEQKKGFLVGDTKVDAGKVSTLSIIGTSFPLMSTL